MNYNITESALDKAAEAFPDYATSFALLRALSHRADTTKLSSEERRTITGVLAIPRSVWGALTQNGEAIHEHIFTNGVAAFKDISVEGRPLLT